MKYITPLNTKRQQSINTDPTLTKQEFKDECDPTKILEKFQRTGLIDHANTYQPVFGDQSAMTYHEALTLKTDAETMFQDLPSSVRQQFNHNVGLYLDSIANPETQEDSKKGIPPTPISTKENNEETVEPSQPNPVETPT